MMLPSCRYSTAVQSRLLCAFLAVWLAGCTAVQLSYNHAGSLLRYKVSDYVDLDETQSIAFQERFSRVQDWHRAKELPAYVQFLEAAGARFSRGLSRADVDWAATTLRTHYRVLTSRAVEEAIPLLPTLSAEQLQSLEKGLAKDESKFRREWLSGGQARRERYVTEKMVERFEQWTGDLSAAQQARVGAFVRAHPNINDVRLQERRRWQREALDLIGGYRAPGELRPRLIRMFAEPDATRPADYQRIMRNYESDLSELIVELDKTLSAEQRQAALRRIERYARDFRELSLQKPSSQQASPP
jgi:hypothetical protein